MEVSGQLHASAALPPLEITHGTHWIGGWVGPRVGLDVVGKRKILLLLGLGGKRISLYHLHELPSDRDRNRII
jgi:hypothetical protein